MTENGHTAGYGDNFGCAYILDTWPARPGGPVYCAAQRRPGSDYCPTHHALCHLRPRGGRERTRLRQIEALAGAVGGRQAKPAGPPSEAWLSRIERASRAVLRPIRSRIVHKEDRMAEGKMTAQSSRKPAPQRDNATAPTLERQQHGPVERLERPIADLSGQPGRPYRAVDTLAVMERRGSITSGMRQAGEDFRARFAVAQLDPLRAIDLSHLRLGERGVRPDIAGPGLRIEAARAAVWRAIQAVGGLGSPAGSCLWHVLGWERSVKEWALEQGWSGRRVSQESAAGILIAALGALESHFGGGRLLREAHFSLDKSGLM
jgi:hypothetical protein